MEEYLTELSRLITNNKFRILNLEESDIISKSIMDNHEKLLFKMDYWECRNILFTKVSHPLKRSLFSFAFACGPPYPLSFNTCLIEVMQTVHMLHPIFPMLPPLQGF